MMRDRRVLVRRQQIGSNQGAAMTIKHVKRLIMLVALALALVVVSDASPHQQRYQWPRGEE